MEKQIYVVRENPASGIGAAILGGVAGLACARALQQRGIDYALLELEDQAGGNARSHVWFRFYNEMPVLVLFAVVFLVVLKPF